MFIGFNTLANLVIFYVDEFDIILGISWLSPYYVVLNYFGKIIIMAMLEGEKL